MKKVQMFAITFYLFSIICIVINLFQEIILIKIIGCVSLFIASILLMIRTIYLKKNYKQTISKKILPLEEIFELEDDLDFSLALYDNFMVETDNGINLDKLNNTKRKLFLCMTLEKFSQTGSILNFINDEYIKYNEEVVQALAEIGAIKSAKIIKQALAILPNDNSRFYDNTNEENKELMERLDSDFSNYPDGKINKLYHQYAEEHKEELLK